MTSPSSNARPKINQRLLTAPADAVLTLAWLRAHGVSGKLANYYVGSGWLHQVGEGAFTVNSETPGWLGAVFGLQQKPTSLHPGGRTALELVGSAHYLPLGDDYSIYLFGRPADRLPAWFKRLPWANRVRHVRSNFLQTDLGLREHRAGSFTLRISDPERAILELLLHLTPDAAAYEHANLLFEGLGTLRAPLVQSLLEKCSSVKVKRLFLHLSEKHGHPWFKELDQAKVSIGSGKRAFFPGGRLDPKYLITVPATTDAPGSAP